MVQKAWSSVNTQGARGHGGGLTPTAQTAAFWGCPAPGCRLLGGHRGAQRASLSGVSRRCFCVCTRSPGGTEGRHRVLTIHQPGPQLGSRRQRAPGISLNGLTTGRSDAAEQPPGSTPPAWVYTTLAPLGLQPADD